MKTCRLTALTSFALPFRRGNSRQRAMPIASVMCVVLCPLLYAQSSAPVKSKTGQMAVLSSNIHDLSEMLADRGIRTFHHFSLPIPPIQPNDNQAVMSGATISASETPQDAWQRTGPDGAIVISLAVDPRIPNTVYAGNLNGGIWKSVDGGVSWNRLTINTPALNVLEIYDLEVSPCTSVVYAATNNNSIFKSTDGGINWSQFPLSKESDIVIDLAIDPFNEEILYAATFHAGLFKSVDGGSSWIALSTAPKLAFGKESYRITPDPIAKGRLYLGTDHGLFISNDGGMNWSPSGTGIAPEHQEIWDIVPDIRDPAKVYIQTHRLGITDGGFYVSKDHGSTWTQLIQSIEGKRIAQSRLSPDTIYISLSGSQSLAKSTDGGATWSFSGTGLPDGGGVLAVLQSAPEILIGQWRYGIWRSIDAGAHWEFASRGMDGVFGVQVAIDPSSPTTIYFAAIDDAGVFKSVDSGQTWINILRERTSSVAVDPFDPKHLVVGLLKYTRLQPEIVESRDAGVSWQTTYNSDDIILWLPSVVFHPSLKNTIFVCGRWGGILKSIDGGRSYSAINSGLATANYWVYSLIVHPSNPNCLYIGTAGGVFKSTDGGNKWVQPNSGIAKEVPSLSIDPNHPQIMYAGTYAESYKSVDGGETWDMLNLPTSPVGYADVVLNSLVPDIVIIGSFQGPTLISEDGGMTWFELNAGSGLMFSDLGNRMVISNTDPQILFRPSPNNGVLSLVLASPNLALISDLWPINGANTNTKAKLWAQVRNISSKALSSSASVQFWIDGPNWSGTHWIGSASTAALAAGAEQWYSFDWEIPAAAPLGFYRYKAQVWTDTVISEWSSVMSFSVGVPPPKVSMISPSGTNATTTPTYKWNAVSESTWYYLWVNDAAGSPKFQQWYTAAQAGCASGMGACSVTPKIVLAPGAAQWWIQTWNSASYGPWSDGMSFSVGGPSSYLFERLWPQLPQPWYFQNPSGVAVDTSGNIIIADTFGHRIQIFNSSGAFLRKWGSHGSGDGQFDYPYGVAVDGSGNVIVADSGNHRIQVFNSNGAFLRKWGSSGSGDGQFNLPYNVAADASGNVHVVDSGNHRIQVFNLSGAFSRKWGSFGSGDGQFNQPQGVAVDASGNVIVADSGNHRIQVFNSNGAFLRKWGSSGSGDGRLFYPHGLAIDGSENIIVADSGNGRIQVFNPSGALLRKWGSTGVVYQQFRWPFGVAIDGSGNVIVADSGNQRIQIFKANGAPLSNWGSRGSGGGHFSQPDGVAVDGSGNVIVADSENHRIQVFNLNGAFSWKWGTFGSGDGQFNQPHGVAVDASGNIIIADTLGHRIQIFNSSGAFLRKWGSWGNGNAQFNSPHGVAVDGSGNVIVADTGNDRIQVFNANGTFLHKWGTSGHGDGQFSIPTAVAVDASGNIIVADYNNNRIQVFNSNGVYARKWGSIGSGDGQLDAPSGVAVDASGNIIVADSGNDRIQIFDSSGNFITRVGSLDSGNFSNPTSVATNTIGVLYVVDTGNNLIQKFVKAASAPLKATLISPSGPIMTTTPTYFWNAVPNATWYCLWVDDGGTDSCKITTWYIATQAGCASGTDICSVTPTTALASGSATWWIQTWNSAGYGPWSGGMKFIVP